MVRLNVAQHSASARLHSVEVQVESNGVLDQLIRKWTTEIDQCAASAEVACLFVILCGLCCMTVQDRPWPRRVQAPVEAWSVHYGAVDRRWTPTGWMYGRWWACSTCCCWR